MDQILLCTSVKDQKAGIDFKIMMERLDQIYQLLVLVCLFLNPACLHVAFVETNGASHCAI